MRHKIEETLLHIGTICPLKNECALQAAAFVNPQGFISASGGIEEVFNILRHIISSSKP
jgi:hypothetical protein